MNIKAIKFGPLTAAKNNKKKQMKNNLLRWAQSQIILRQLIKHLMFISLFKKFKDALHNY